METLSSSGRSSVVSKRAEESVGDSFSLAAMKESRDLGWQAVERIKNNIKMGMTEKDAVKMAARVMHEMKIPRHWHAPIVRMGPGTLKSYKDPASEDYFLKADDIFYVDLGPVSANGHEADVGATFTIGKNEEFFRCAKDSEMIFKETAKAWREGQLSGEGLYEFAKNLSKEKGWELMPMDAGGHRLSDFPHKLHYKGNLRDKDFNPAPYVWVLEIQIRHPEKEFAAFFEDLLF